MSYKIYLIDKTHLLSPRGVVEWFKASLIPPIEKPALYPIKLVVNKTGLGVIWL